MKTSTKIWMCIAGVALVALGVMCILCPGTTLLSLAWVFGLMFFLGESNRVLGIFSGQPEMLCSHETYQFNDYSKYEIAVDEPTRAHIRETRFPQDLQKAYELGKRLVEKAKQ